MIRKLHKTRYAKVEDLDEKGRVVIGVNAFGNEDSDGDISMCGSFTKTLQENFARVKWFLNHNQNILLGVPISGVEDENHLKMTAAFNMNKQISRETYEDYKLYAEYGKTLEHSIGVDAVKRDKSDNRKVLEWKLWEFSTLTNWGSNANTPLIDIKSIESMYSTEADKVDAGTKGTTETVKTMIEKSIEDFVTYVRCPHCWGRVSRANIKATEPSEGTLIIEKGSRSSTFDLKTINNLLRINS